MAGQNTEEEFEGISPEELEALMSGDPEDMEKAFSADLHADLDSGEIDKAAKQGDTSADDDEGQELVAQPAAAAKSPAVDGGAKTPGASGEDDPEKQVVLAADGKTPIPYEVLKGTRQENTRLRNELANTQSVTAEQQQQIDLLQRREELLQKQLKAAGISPGSLPEELQVTPELLEAASEYGEAGKLIIALNNQVTALSAQLKGSTPQSTNAQNVNADDVEQNAQAIAQEVNAALNANADLVAWRDGDPDRFADAVMIDKKLRDQPQWKDKPYAERFAEVSKRVKAMHGDEPAIPSLQQLQKKLNAGDDALDAPLSLSNVGRADSKAERKTNLDGMSEEQIIDAYSNIPLEDLEAELAPYM